ncbi:MAG: hypothetical protein IJY49_06010 [Clostridia bacterium]|nr:hypothetical protein [Clostridia bacterium]
MTKRNLRKRLKEQFEKLLPDFSFKEKVVETVTPEAEMLKAKERARVKAMFTSKRAIMSFVATCLIVCVGLGVGLGLGLNGGMLTPDGDDPSTHGGDPAPAPTYMSVDINPSFGIEVDEDGVVVSVEALNEDAVIVLLDTDLVGKTVEEVFTTIVSLAEELGYLKEDGTVNVVMSNDSAAALQEAIATRVENVLDDVNALLSAENITINIEKGKEALVSALEEAGKFVEGMEDWSAEHLHKYFKDYDSEKIDAFIADVKAQGEEIRATLEEEYAKLKPIADKIVDAYNKKDYVNFALAILEAGEYIAMYIDSADLNVALDEFGAFILGSPEMVGDFCTFLEDMAEGNHSDEIEDMILNQIKGQLKDKHDKESGENPDGQNA